MQNLNYWMQFENTGKVEDYLSYCACGEMNICRDGSALTETDAAGMEVCAADREQRTGVNLYAGIPMGNGDGIETDAYR